jgi:uncharacterized protein
MICSGANYFFGGLLLILSGIGEFLLGNTFPSVVFMGYGAHFLTSAATFTPAFAAISSYTTDGSMTQTPTFLASFGVYHIIHPTAYIQTDVLSGFYFLFMSVLSLIFLVCSFRTNLVFVLVFTCATMGFGLAAGGFWHLAEGNITPGNRLLVGTGACFFGASIGGWYLLFAIMISAVDMPFVVPVFDLSTVIKGLSEKKRARTG